MISKIEKNEVPVFKIRLTPCVRTIIDFIGQSEEPVDSREINTHLKQIEASCKTSKRPLKNLCKTGLLEKKEQPKEIKNGVRRKARYVYSITTKGKEVINKKKR